MSKTLDEIIRKACSFDHRDRYPDVGELKKDLEEFITQQNKAGLPFNPTKEGAKQYLNSLEPEKVKYVREKLKVLKPAELLKLARDAGVREDVAGFKEDLSKKYYEKRVPEFHHIQKALGIAKYGVDFETATIEQIKNFDIMQVCGYLSYHGREQADKVKSIRKEFNLGDVEKLQDKNISKNFIDRLNTSDVSLENLIKIEVAIRWLDDNIPGIYACLNRSAAYIYRTIKLLEHAVKKVFDDSRLYHLLGLYNKAFFESQENQTISFIENAATHLERAVMLSNNADYKIDYLKTLVLKHKCAGNFNAAAEKCEELAGLTHAPQLRLEASELYQKAGNLEKAIKVVYRTWNDQEWERKFEARLADLFFDTNQYKRAIKELYHTPSYPYSDSFRMSLIAASFYNLKNYQTAKTVCEEALTSHPNDAYFHHLLGQAFRALDFTRDAKKELKIASALEPDNEKYRSDLEKCVNLSESQQKSQQSSHSCSAGGGVEYSNLGEFCRNLGEMIRNNARDMVSSISKSIVVNGDDILINGIKFKLPQKEGTYFYDTPQGRTTIEYKDNQINIF